MTDPLKTLSHFAPHITDRPVDALTAFDRNARTHSGKQIAKIAAAIQRFGFINPIITDKNGRILAGHGRFEAAKQLKMSTVPTICLDHLSDDEKRAYVLADNRLAELAGYDDEILKAELRHLCDVEFDVELTGFETGEIDLLLDGASPAASKDDTVPEPEAVVISRPGDLWHLGAHRLLCGDACEAASYDRLMGGRKAVSVFADPPYNVAVDGHASGNGAIHHRAFAMASGEMSPTEYSAFLSTIFGHLIASSRDGSIHYICMDWRHLPETLKAGTLYGEHKNLIVWDKGTAGMGSFYRSQHELILVFKNGTAPHINNFGLGEMGRYRTNVWSYPGLNAGGAKRREQLLMHPTVKPVAMVADAIRDCSRRGDLILDPFMGSGTTLIAAERTGRVACGLELDPAYVDTAIRRYEAATGQTAELSTGESFAEVAADREGTA